MATLIVKLGATGDVVRTTPLLRRLSGDVTWITETKNVNLLRNLNEHIECFSWEERKLVVDRAYDLVINLEDTIEVAELCRKVKAAQWFGAYANSEGKLRYTADSSRWFDLSLISVHGREEADLLKLHNRSTYQELIFDGLGLAFQGEQYILPQPSETQLAGDVAIASEAGPVWPMKNWAYYIELKKRLESHGLVVNVLPKRSSLLEHLADVQNHRCVVGGDSLPMHFALGTGIPCVTLFTCTSPWEIYGYGIQTKIISPLLEQFFYKRGYDARATTAITLEQVESAAFARLEPSTARARTSCE